MTTPMDCGALREIAPELVVDSLDGALRADALAHLSSCPACRAEINSLADTAEALTLLAPEAEPPAGFVDRVLEAMRTEAAPAPPVPINRPRRRWRLPATIAAVAAAALLGIVGTVAFEHHDNGPAGVALNARTLRSVQMVGANDAAVGDVYVSTGAQPWVLVYVDYGLTGTGYRLVGVQHDGAVVDVGRMRAISGQWAWAGQFAAASTLMELRVVDGMGAVVCRAVLPASTS